MIQVPVYNKLGVQTGTVDLAPEVFGVEVNTTLVHDVVVSSFANQRQVLAHTKTRGEVRGGGKKPWRQKGTGRARHSSIRSPLWRGGGITFGPRNDRNFKEAINKKAKAKAMRMILSDRIANGALLIVDDFAFAEPKTKLFASLKAALPVSRRRAIVVSDKKDEALLQMTRNIATVKTTFVGEFGVLDMVQHPYMIMSKSAVEALAKKYSA